MAQPKLLVLMVLVVSASTSRRRPCMGTDTIASREFVVDYALWRNWTEVVLFVSPTAGCWLPAMVDALNKRNVLVGLQPLRAAQLPTALSMARHRLGAVVPLTKDSAALEDLLEQVSQKIQFHAYVSWLMFTDSALENKFRFLNVGLDADLVVASITISYRDIIPDLQHRKFSSRPTVEKEFLQIKSLRSKSSSNSSKRAKSNTRRSVSFTLNQLYKIRSIDNSSLVSVALGQWDRKNGTSKLRRPLDVEQRANLQGFPLFVGIKNSSMGGGVDMSVGGAANMVKDLMTASIDDDSDDDDNLLGVLEFIARSINASYELIPFPKLGWRNGEGAWLHLLGAVSQGTVDLGLDNVVITEERAADMFFSFPIVESMKNIYFRRPDGGAMRDIFLAPFSPRLIGCVAATGVILALVVAAVNSLWSGSGWGVGEALVWSVSVLCMQGSPWKPRTASGSLVLIFGLCFALIIYNAYAAFITSVLSVRVASIRGLDDLLQSDFQFGYTLAGQDEIFLRTVNDTSLRRLYFRGLVRNHGVDDAAEGLRRVSEGGYAFFVSSRLARRALASSVGHETRCGVQELAVEATRSSIALPMSHNSPYKRLVNLSLMRMREAGALARARLLMLPPMPRCQTMSTFNSARLADVYSAFLLLGIGVTAGAGLGVAEALWRRRRLLRHIKWKRKEHNFGLLGAGLPRPSRRWIN